ncbi:hypothetical protein [Burkholderia cenocepacia]|uniref:hypothetical protein n=1 Tax=Burkholderia cenocepacia TaxID=95486 RepID=UPI0024AF2203|nr:hypothetical protein [Burkholderia cenocepacia]
MQRLQRVAPCNLVEILEAQPADLRDGIEKRQHHANGFAVFANFKRAPIRIDAGSYDGLRGDPPFPRS